MISKNDWRRMGQENYLLGVQIKYIPQYEPYSETWEHEHCCFCTQKISQLDGEAHSGYCTTNEKQSNWICEDCFRDFKEEFNWILIE